ncbi:hypothetical protein [Paraliobacillus ryukyuensis]|uniref:hypothetical protein n=1 Tax=Paraliobacillus ryukyuensis TaxID=200904 RepID=UPI0009A7D3E2|nr:hypothetical protein [Paraliobacillus ryukyuensis]
MNIEQVLNTYPTNSNSLTPYLVFLGIFLIIVLILLILLRIKYKYSIAIADMVLTSIMTIILFSLISLPVYNARIYLTNRSWEETYLVPFLDAQERNTIGTINEHKFKHFNNKMNVSFFHRNSLVKVNCLPIRANDQTDREKMSLEYTVVDNRIVKFISKNNISLSKEFDNLGDGTLFYNTEVIIPKDVKLNEF